MTWFRLWCWRLRKDPRRFLPASEPGSALFATIGRHLKTAEEKRRAW